MTGEQKQQIYILRRKRMCFADIAAEMGLPRNTIKTFCWRNGLTDADLAAGLPNRGFRGFCKACGKELTQRTKSRPLVYCSDKCRNLWWNAHKDAMTKRPENYRKCAVCGTEFYAFPSQKKRYCSHECYIAARYGGGNGGNHDEG